MTPERWRRVTKSADATRSLTVVLNWLELLQSGK